MRINRLFITILGDTMMMVTRTTETCWGLSIYNKIHCTKLHALVYYIYYLA